jgi:hypothetical protein
MSGSPTRSQARAVVGVIALFFSYLTIQATSSQLQTAGQGQIADLQRGGYQPRVVG